MKKEVLVFFLTFLFCDLFSQVYVVNNRYLQAYEHVVRFEREKALLLIQEEYKKQNNRNLLMFQLESNVYFIDAFLTETKESRKRWTDRFQHWEKSFTSGKRQSPYYTYCIANLYFQKGLLGLKHMEYLQAGIDIRKAARLLEKNERQFPDFYIQYKESGLLNCFIGNIPEQLEWLTGIAGIKGDMKTGEGKLSKILDLSFQHREFEFLQMDALLYNATVATILYTNTDRVSELTRYIKRVKPEYRNSPLFIYVSSMLYSHLGNNDEALKHVARYRSEKGEIRFDYLDYFHGLLLLQQGRAEAKRYFETFIRYFNGMHYVRSAYHKLAWCWLLEGNEQQYDLYISMAANSGKSATDSDRQAMIEAKSGTKPHRALLKARLLCDGGYYEQALSEISGIDSAEICNDHVLCVEYFYRIARIYHLKNELFRAVDLYKRVIESGSNDREYFAANSALMLGTIYEEMKDYQNASRYYNLCLNMQFEEYRNSIQQKAKAGLQRIR